MDSLFSHEPQDGGCGGDRAGDVDESGSVHFTVSLPVSMDQAIEGFTEYVHLWWPEESTVYGEGAFVALDAEALTEESSTGQRVTLARVRANNVDSRLELSGEFGRGAEGSARVVVEFGPDASPDADTDMTTGTAGSTVGVTAPAAGSVTTPDETSNLDWAVLLGAFSRFMGGSTPTEGRSS